MTSTTAKNFMGRIAPFAGIAILSALVSAAGCDPYDQYCGRVEQCANDDEKGFDEIDPDDDYRGTCAAQLRANERVLRANEEEDCQVLADAYRLHTACLASLECDDLNDEFRQADKCESERDDYQDALEDADGECQTASFGACNSAGSGTNTTTALLVALAVLLRRRRR